MKQEPLMSAEKTHEENTARKEDEPIFPAAVPLWMRVTVQPDGSELPHEPVPEMAKGHEGGPDGTPEDDETYAFLLQAIQGTEFAKLLGGIPPPNDSPLPLLAFSVVEPEAVTTAPDVNPVVVSPADEATGSEPAPMATAHLAASDEIAEHAEATAAPLERAEGAQETTVEIAGPAGGEAGPVPASADSAEIAAESAELEAPLAVVAAAAAPEAEPVVMTTVAPAEAPEAEPTVMATVAAAETLEAAPVVTEPVLPEPAAVATAALGPEEAPPETADATEIAAEMEVVAPAEGVAPEEVATADSTDSATAEAEVEPAVAEMPAAAAAEAEPVAARAEGVAPEEAAAAEATDSATAEAEVEPAIAEVPAAAAADAEPVAARAEGVAPEEAAEAEATDSATAEAEVEPAVAEMPAAAAAEAEPAAAPAMRKSESGEESEISAAPLQESEETQVWEEVEDAAPSDAAAVQELLTASAVEIAAPSPAVEEPAASPALAESEPRRTDARGVVQPNRRAAGVNGLRRRRGHRGGKGRYAAPRERNVSTRPPRRVRFADEVAENAAKETAAEPEVATPAAAQSVAEILTPAQENFPLLESPTPAPPRPSSALRIFEAPVLPEMPPPAQEVAAVEREAEETPQPAEPVRIEGASTATETVGEAAKEVTLNLPAPAIEAAAAIGSEAIELPAPAIEATAATGSEPVELPATTESNGTQEILSPAEPLPEPTATTFSPDSPARDKNGNGKAASSGRPVNGLGRVTLRQTGEYLDRAEMHLETWFLKWFDPPDPRRRNNRVAAPPLAAYHWTMDVPQGLKIADISPGGMYLITEERWTEGVIVSLTLQRTDMEKGSPDSWIAVDFVVTRWGRDGIGGEFIPRRPGLTDAVAGRASNCADKKTLERFVSQLAAPAPQ
ncbi:MAG TPA: hypothetical protein VGR47_03505 [Terracidiphilus sp.]|nr:hypothetical protein [Terracidiphilus sp.]